MAEQQNVSITFRFRGLRSYIDLDLCARCPRQDQKGCCGHYSPVFYLLDLAYLYMEEPQLIEQIFSLPRLTVLDHSITLNKIPDGDGFICPMLDKSDGCRLPQLRRESVCRHFICSGVDWQKRPDMKSWVDFFEDLGELEIAINQKWALILEQEGLTLRNPSHRTEIYSRAAQYLRELLEDPPLLVCGEDYDQEYTLRVSIEPETEWVL